MTSIVKYVLVLCVLFVAGYTNAQITINTNFSVLSNQPIDSRDTLTTLADTSSVTWTFPGLLSYVVDIDEFWYYTGAQWRKLFDGTTIPSSAPDSLIVYAPAHGLSDTIALYGYVPVKADFTRANSTSIDSVFIAYAIDAPDADSLLLIFSGVLTYGSWHGKELNTQYYLQDDGSDDTTPGTVSVPTAIASDSLTLFLREVGSDIAGQLRRVAMPSPLITAFGGNPASPTDTVVQLAISTLYLPAGLAQPGTIFTLSYPTQSYNPTYQQIFPNTNPLTPSYAWLWDGAYATRIVNIPTSVNLQDTNYGVLGTLILLPIDSLGSLPPTDSLVAMWVDTNYTANNLRLANGSLLYYIGNGTRQSPDYIWQIIDDISYDAGDTNWEKIIKKINQPGGSVPAIRNDLPNESILIDPNNNDLVIGADSLDNTGEIEFFVLTPVDSQNVVFFIGQRDSSSVVAGEGFPMDALISSFGDEDGVIGINFDYFSTVWNTAMFGDSMLVAAYPSSTLTYVLEHLPRSPADTMSAVLVQDWVTKRVYIRDADSFGSEPDSSMYATVYALADTAAAIRGDMTSGVTSVATGYGLSGGPITTTGTISADTAQLATVYDVSLKQNILNGTGIVKSTAGTISYLTDGTANWNAAYNDKINSAAVTGTTSKTLTLTQQDAGTVTAGFTDLNGIYAGSGNVPDSTYAKAITAADNSAYGTAIGYFPGYPDQTYRDRGLLISPYNQSVSLWSGDSIATTQYIYNAVGVDRTSAFVGSGYNGYNNNRTTNNFTTPDSAVVATASLASGATFFSVKEKRIMLGKRTLTPTEHRYFNLWASDTLNNGYLELFEKYRLANATPSTTSGDTSFMVWIGNGSGTTPSFIEMASISGGGGGGSPQTLSTSNDSLTISGGNTVKLPINELVTDSLANDSITFDFEARYQKIFSTDMTSAIDPVTVLLSNPIEGGVYTLDFSDVTGAIDIVWPSNVKNLDRVSLGTYTYSGSFIQTLYYDGTNYIAIPQPEPAIAFENDSVTTTTLTIDLEFKRQKIVEIDMASVATSVTLTVNNPFYGSNESGVYTFHFMGVSGTDNVVWPAAFVDSNYTALGTDALTTGTIYTCYYNPNSLKYICK